MPSDTNKRIHILFSGHVQGVGFRYTALDIAGRYLISGWVRNLGDGRVEAQAQGVSEDLDNFLNALKSEFPGYIKEATVEELTPCAGENGFEIKY